MQSVKRPSRAISEGGVFKGVRSGPKESRSRVGCLTSGESSSTPIGSDRGHPCSFKGYTSVQEERGANRGAGRKLHGQETLREEVEVY